MVYVCFNSSYLPGPVPKTLDMSLSYLPCNQ